MNNSNLKHKSTSVADILIAQAYKACKWKYLQLFSVFSNQLFSLLVFLFNALYGIEGDFFFFAQVS